MSGAEAGAAVPGPGRPAPARAPSGAAPAVRGAEGLRDGLCAAALGAAFALSVLLVGPGGEFPLNDDWSFVRTVRALLATHDWRPLGWASMAQISHALLGSAVCAVASCTFEHLRGAVLLAGLALALGTFALCRRAGVPRLAAALGGAAVALNPVLHPLAFTFMTDVPFALMMLGGAAAGAAMLRTGRWRDVLLAAALVTAATLSRQLGAAVAAGLLPAYLAASRERMAVRLAKAALPLATAAAALAAFERWMRATGRMPALYDSTYAKVAAALAAPLNLAGVAATNLVLCGLYLGLACLPVLLLCPVARPFPVRAPGRWAAVAVLAALLVMAREGAIMPLLGNVFGKAGVGPLTLRDAYVLGLPNVPELPAWSWAAVTACSLLGLWLLVFRALDVAAGALDRIRAGSLDPAGATRLLGLAATACYLLVVSPGAVFDRYAVAVAPVLLLGIAPRRAEAARAGPRRAALACGTAAALALASTLATHDAMAWQRARWQAIGDVEGRGEADAATMDGGFEYNGYRAYDPLYAAKPGKSWWWVDDDRVVIAFGPVPGMDVVRRYPYETWLPPGARDILVLRRAAPRAPAQNRSANSGRSAEAP